ncbi:MAG: hypothetical protein UW72_C0013G0005 [Parcubacteria group bacterium GW2011_GWF2_44_7]|nr:MAG: hypothetical protein UW72_C0013G0005 [Parcubacteria group bacterium GW2011_GWF2_44_7]
MVLALAAETGTGQNIQSITLKTLTTEITDNDLKKVFITNNLLELYKTSQLPQQQLWISLTKNTRRGRESNNAWAPIPTGYSYRSVY